MENSVIGIQNNICKGVCPCCEMRDREHLLGCYYEACADCGENHGKHGCWEVKLMRNEILAREEEEEVQLRREEQEYRYVRSSGWDGNG